MKFCLEKTIMHTNIDRVIVLVKTENYFKDENEWNVKYMCNVLIKTTQDFDIDQDFPIVSDTCSIQIRPKGIFKTSKGYFYKLSNKERIYLTKGEEIEMIDFIERAKVFLTKN